MCIQASFLDFITFSILSLHRLRVPIICFSMEMAAPVKKPDQGSESPGSSTFSLKEKLQMFSVDTSNRWPVQGWSSGDDASSYELDEDFVAEECAREFAMDHETRWPLQGWCKANNNSKSTSNAARDQAAHGSTKRRSVQSRWPLGW